MFPKNMGKALFVILIFLFVPLSSAVYVNVLEPVQITVEEKSAPILLGPAGPGQTVYIVSDSEVREDSGKRGRWDILRVVSLPEGWNAEDSLQYEQPLKAKIKISPSATDGMYETILEAVDIYEGFGKLRFRCKVNVTKDVMKMGVYPEERRVGVKQPAIYFVSIENKGVASDEFDIYSQGIPAWRYKRTVFVPFRSTKIIQFEVVGEEETPKPMEITIRVVSRASPLISEEKKVKFYVHTDIFSNYKATGHGLLLFPLIQQPIYSLMSFISNIIEEIT